MQRYAFKARPATFVGPTRVGTREREAFECLVEARDGAVCRALLVGFVHAPLLEEAVRCAKPAPTLVCGPEAERLARVRSPEAWPKWPEVALWREARDGALRLVLPLLRDYVADVDETSRAVRAHFAAHLRSAVDLYDPFLRPRRAPFHAYLAWWMRAARAALPLPSRDERAFAHYRRM